MPLPSADHPVKPKGPYSRHRLEPSPSPLEVPCSSRPANPVPSLLPPGSPSCHRLHLRWFPPRVNNLLPCLLELNSGAYPPPRFASSLVHGLPSSLSPSPLLPLDNPPERQTDGATNKLASGPNQPRPSQRATTLQMPHALPVVSAPLRISHRRLSLDAAHHAQLGLSRPSPANPYN